MAQPRVPGDSPGTIDLPCGETVSISALDLGMREFRCDCGDDHAVVMDVHPPARFVPEAIVEVLRESVTVEDEFEEFGTPHVMGAVLEEFPDRVVVHDASGDGEVGYALCWIADFDDRRLHEVVVDLLVELMDHAISHAEDDAHAATFQDHLEDFDVEAFVEQYRRQRDLDSGSDPAHRGV